MTALTELNCDNNGLKELDLSKNTALKYLNCDYNGLKELDVNHNTALTYLKCSNNQITTLDISKLTSLSGESKVIFYNNKMTTLIKNDTNQADMTFQDPSLHIKDNGNPVDTWGPENVLIASDDTSFPRENQGKV